MARQTTSDARATLRRATASLKHAGVDSPRLCAETLLAHAIGGDRLRLMTEPALTLSSDQAERFNGLVQRRLAREPLQHIVGRTEFWSLPILCDRRALIPRPETELLVETALELARGMEPPQSGAARESRHCEPAKGGRSSLWGSVSQAGSPDSLTGCAPRDCRVVPPHGVGTPRNDPPFPLIADIGTGTGCIAIAMACELPQARIVATDVSSDALALAAENIAMNGVGCHQEGQARWDSALHQSRIRNQQSEIGNRRVTLRHGDLCAPLALEGPGAYDMILSNPPYIPDADIEALQPEVRDHDPGVALRGGPEGCTIILRLLREALTPLRAGGFLVMEIGIGEAEFVRRIVSESMAGRSPGGSLRGAQRRSNLCVRESFAESTGLRAERLLRSARNDETCGVGESLSGGWKLVRVARDGAGIERVMALQKER